MKKILFLFLLVFSILGLSSCNSKVDDNILNSSRNEDICYFLYRGIKSNNRDGEYFKFFTDGTIENYHDNVSWESVDGMLIVYAEDTEFYYYMDKSNNLLQKKDTKRWRYKRLYYITTVYKVEDTEYQEEVY